MTASRSDRIAWLALVLVAGACRNGLPPEPPGANAADPQAPVSKYERGPSPYETSAFEGVELDAGGGHHHGHGHHGHQKGGK